MAGAAGFGLYLDQDVIGRVLIGAEVRRRRRCLIKAPCSSDVQGSDERTPLHVQQSTGCSDHDRGNWHWQWVAEVPSTAHSVLPASHLLL